MTHPLPPGCGILGYGPVWRPAAAWPGPEVHGWPQIPGSCCSTPHRDACCYGLPRLPDTMFSNRKFISMHYVIMRTSNTPLVSSFRTTSEISNSLRGRGIFLLAASVFRSPGRREVRATYRRVRFIESNLTTNWFKPVKAPTSGQMWEVSVFLWVPETLRSLGWRCGLLWFLRCFSWVYLRYLLVSTAERGKDHHIIEKIPKKKDNICYIVLVAVYKKLIYSTTDVIICFQIRLYNWHAITFLFLSECYWLFLLIHPGYVSIFVIFFFHQ